MDSVIERDEWEREVRAVVDRALDERFPPRVAGSARALVFALGYALAFALGLLVGWLL
jgi:hypothetical protein